MATTIEYTWNTPDQNRAAADYSTTALLAASFGWHLYAGLTGNVGGMTLGLWTIYSSCDGSGGTNFGNGDQVDWIGKSSFNGAKWVRAAAASNHTWFVLKSPSIGGANYYLIADWSGAAAATPLNLVWCKTAPTGGTATARPTSADENAHAANLTLHDNTASNSKSHLHLASNGQWIFYASKNSSGFAHVAMIGAVLADTQAGDVWPYVQYAAYASSTPGALASSASAFYGNSQWKSRGYDGVAMASTYATSKGYLNDYWGGVPAGGDRHSGKKADAAVEIYGFTSPNYEYKGRLVDIRRGITATGAIAQGNVEPAPAGPIVSAFVGGHWIPATQAPSF